MKNGLHKSLVFIVLVIGIHLNANAQSNCDDDKYQIFNRLIGKWNEIDDDDPTDKRKRVYESRKISAGCSLQQSYTSDSVTFNSFLYLDNDGDWKEIVINNDGKINKYRWIQNEEEFILEQINSAGPNKRRFVISDIYDQEYWLVDERSSDWGQSWNLVKKLKRVRVKEKDFAPETIK